MSDSGVSVTLYITHGTISFCGLISLYVYVRKFAEGSGIKPQNVFFSLHTARCIYRVVYDLRMTRREVKKKDRNRILRWSRCFFSLNVRMNINMYTYTYTTRSSYRACNVSIINRTVSWVFKSGRRGSGMYTRHSGRSYSRRGSR